MAILLLGEQPRLFHLIGYVLVFAGVVIASRQGSAAGLASRVPDAVQRALGGAPQSRDRSAQ
jgi:drug/metabolite transporter (DMT)-like permease